MLSPSRLRTFFLTVLAFTCAAPLAAAPLLNGVAVHTELGKEQFIGGLYSDRLSTDANTLLTADVNKQVQVRVLADQLSSRRFKRMWIEGIAINSSQNDLQDHAQNMADFSNMLRAKLTRGDILTIARSTEDGVTISLNGTRLGSIADRHFFDVLLRTWIGPVPLSSNFRDNLLSNGEVEAGLLGRFETTRPSDERIAAVERAVQALNREKVAKVEEEEPELAAAVDTPRDLIEPPTLDKPTLAMVPPSLGAMAPPELAGPNSDPAKPATQPEPKPQPKPEPEPAEQQLAKATPPPATTSKPEPQADEIFEEDDEEETFTAASLLKQQLYIGQIKSWAQKELKYPDRALRREWEGNVRLDVTLDRAGKLVSVEIAEEAEYSVLTKEALRAVRKAEPFPAVPEEVKGDTFLFTLPVAFKLAR